MVFPRLRFLIKIELIIFKICLVLSLVAGLVLGIVFATISKQAFMFFILFGSGIAAAATFFLAIKFTQWLCKDFDELDSTIAILRAGVHKLKKQNEEKAEAIINTETQNEVVGVEISENNEQGQPVNEIAIDQQPQKANSTTFKPGDIFVLNRDFTDYGFNFKKGMQGIFQEEIESNNTVSVHMTSEIKGFFRFPKEYLDKEKSAKNKI